MKKTGILFLLFACLMLVACGTVEKTASESKEVFPLLLNRFCL
ncbi:MULTISPECIES: hypothetical protein [Bacillus]|nr:MULTISPECIES: hypothetical protein [Bacillus]MCU5386090.1 hypothetical protein [Bacillus cereus]MDA2510581.1 hypothetical protein [Bacillus cereus]MDC2942070.1 hypothetical protein [Bacillus thuringiensis]MDF9489150.1 hypothetical protein [Bacillus cereus]MEC0018975.1 hypothetical protein [Bacillus anthracis]